MLYVDSSALLKWYVDEHDSEAVAARLTSETVLVTSRLTEVEVRRNLTRLLDGDELIDARRRFTIDFDAFNLVSLDGVVLADAAHIAESTLCRSLDAIHLAAARRVNQNIAVFTFDVRQAQVAREIGLVSIGA